MPLLFQLALLCCELRQEFLERAATDSITLSEAWKDAQSPETERRGLETLAFLAHRLAGLGRTFGYPAITDTGLSVESEAERQLEQGGALSAQLGASVAELRAAVESANS